MSSVQAAGLPAFIIMPSSSSQTELPFGATKCIEWRPCAPHDAPEAEWCNFLLEDVQRMRVSSLRKWAKWARKLLDHKLLQSYWAMLGHYLRRAKERKVSRLTAR